MSSSSGSSSGSSNQMTCKCKNIVQCLKCREDICDNCETFEYDNTVCKICFDTYYYETSCYFCNRTFYQERLMISSTTYLDDFQYCSLFNEECNTLVCNDCLNKMVDLMRKDKSIVKIER